MLSGHVFGLDLIACIFLGSLMLKYIPWEHPESNLFVWSTVQGVFVCRAIAIAVWAATSRNVYTSCSRASSELQQLEMHDLRLAHVTPSTLGQMSQVKI